MNNNSIKLVPLGKIIKPHGIKGEMRLSFFNNDSKSLNSNQIIFLEDNKSLLNENITVLSFLGSDPMGNITSVLNLKELIYDKFKG